MSKIKPTSTQQENKKKLDLECPGIYASNLIGGQWTMSIMCFLRESKLRFGELKRCIPNITERMLTLQLRKMEANKLVKRTVFAEVPPRVEYELTKIGKDVLPIMDKLEEWGKKHKKKTADK